jgi:hypothetical protein
MRTDKSEFSHKHKISRKDAKAQRLRQVVPKSLSPLFSSDFPLRLCATPASLREALRAGSLREIFVFNWWTSPVL